MPCLSQGAVVVSFKVEEILGRENLLGWLAITDCMDLMADDCGKLGLGEWQLVSSISYGFSIAGI